MARRLGIALGWAYVSAAALTGCAPADLCGALGTMRAVDTSCAGEKCLVEGHPLGKEVAYPWLDAGDLASADLILGDVWPVTRFEPVQLPAPLTWREDPYQEKYWQFVFYGLRPTTHLLWAFYRTKDRRYRDKLLEVLASFAERGRTSPFARDKHGTAFRAMVLVNTYWKLKHARALSEAEAHLLEELVRAEGRFLADPENFEPKGNHAFAEAAALLLVAENFPGWEESVAWRELALARYDGTLSRTVGEDGFIAENSTYYHFYVLAQVWQLARWARAHGVELSPRLDATVAGMVRLGTFILQPDGRIPMLGGSQDRQVRKYERRLFGEVGAAYPEFGYVLSMGRCGVEPRERLAVFPSAGLAILRSAFGHRRDFLSQTHVVLDAGPYRTRHSHLDALNVHLYAAGRTLLTDPGLFTEEEGPELDAFRSTRFHNTVTVDGADQREGAASLGVTREEDGWLYQSGTHMLYDGVRHWRGVVLLAPDVVLVLDQLDAAAPHRYEQRWHLPPDLAVTLEGSSADVTDAQGTHVLQVRQALPHGLGASTVRGATSPLDGWYSERYEVREPASVLVYTREGAQARYATLFAAGAHARSPARVSAVTGSGVLDVTACAAGRSHHVRVERPGQAAEQVTVQSSAADCGSGG